MKSDDSARQRRSTPAQRRYDIDWIRVSSVLLLIPYHTAVIFDRGHVSYIKGQPNTVMVALAHFLSQWHMPLFFLLSGTATWYSLDRRGGIGYIRERITRLVVPLLFGTFAIIPFMVYCQRLYYREFDASYIRFYPHFFDGIYPSGNFSWGHLWFLAYLFVFSMTATPLFLYLKSDGGSRLISGLAAFCNRRGAIFLFALPLAAIETGLRAKWPGLQNLYDDWANVCLFVTMFTYGYLFCSDARFGSAIDRHWKASLMAGIPTMTVILALHVTGTHSYSHYGVRWILYMVLDAFNRWFWIIAILGFGRRYLGFTNNLLAYMTEAALPIYILHHAVVVATGYHVVAWNMGVLEKFLCINVASLLMIVALYDLLVRRISLPRILFGMNPGTK